MRRPARYALRRDRSPRHVPPLALSRFHSGRTGEYGGSHCGTAAHPTIAAGVIMASIIKQSKLRTPAPALWAQLRDSGKIDKVIPGFFTSTQEGDVRTLSFKDGTVLRERIVDINDAAMRIAYTVLGDTVEHHNASMQVTAVDGGSELVWITDILPDSAAATIAPLLDTLWAALPGKA
jgi:Polyketide cyclase / dehydrase and lipid transport